MMRVPSYFFLLGIEVVALLSSVLCQDGQCFTETPVTSQFVTTAFSSYNQTFISTQTCKDECGKQAFTIAAIENASFCFCGVDYTGLATSTGCSSTCVDALACGGPLNGDVTLYLVIPQIAAAITVTLVQNGTIVKIADVVTATVNASEYWVLDWGDGDTITLNDTDHVYDLPGIYTATGSLQSYPNVQGEMQITVHDTPVFTIICPDVLALAVPQNCTVNSTRQGFDYKLTFSMTNLTTTDAFTASLPAEQLRVYGNDFDADVLTGATLTTGTLAIAENSKIENGGYVVRVRANAAVAGTLGIYAVTPKCTTGTYCGITELCTTTCATQGAPLSCATHLCPLYGSCSSTVCATGTDPVAGQYDFTLLTTVAITATGNFDYDLPEAVWIPAGSEIGFGCDTAANCLGSPADIQRRNASAYEDGNYLLLDTTTFTASSSPYRYLVQIVVRDDPHITLPATLLCLSPAPIPNAEVPLPFDATTEQYVFLGKLVLNYTIESATMGTFHQETRNILCQENITNPVLSELEIWMPYGQPYPFTVTFSQGSPLFSAANIDGVLTYNYQDSAAGGWSWAFNLVYAQEGLYYMTGNTSNVLGYVLYESIVHVVPVVTDTWIMSFTCPCYDIDLGFPFSLQFPSAPHPPWNATVSTTYELGNLFPQELVDFGTLPAGGAAAPLLISKTAVILAKGTYNVTVTLTNEVSNTTVSQIVTVEEGIRDVTASMLWNNSGIIMNGLGAGGSMFLANSSVFFYPTCRTGVPFKWKITINETGEVFETTSAAENFTLTFPQNGAYTVIVSGYNSVQGWVDSPPIPVTIVSNIQGFVLTDNKQVTAPGENKDFIGNFSIFTPMACIIINYGDNSPSELYGYEQACKEKYPDFPYNGTVFAPVTMPHIYQQEGMYDVVAIAFDDGGSFYQTISVVVGYVPCTMPTVTIVDGTVIPSGGKDYWMSLSIYIEALGSFQCNGTFPVKRWWTISEVDNENGTSIRDVTPADPTAVWDNSNILLNERFLTYGTYKFTFYLKIVISATLYLQRYDFTYINVIPSPLKPVIMVGSPSRIERGYGQMVILEPGQLSSDPDYPEDRNLTFTWWCQQISPFPATLQKDANNEYIYVNAQPVPTPEEVSVRTGEGCFGLENGALDQGYPLIPLNTASFIRVVASYQFVLKVQKGNRSAVTTLTIDLVTDPPPIMQISCDPALCWSSIDALIINPTKRLALAGLCIFDCTDVMEYAWTITSESGQVVNESTALCNSTSGGTITMEQSTCQPTFLTSKNSSDLAIASVFFSNNYNIDSFRFRITGTTSLERSGYTEIIVKINKPPINGYCALQAMFGDALISVYPAACQNWIDPESIGIMSYTFYYYEQTSVGPIRKTLADTAQSSINLILPVGNHDLFVDITDRLSAVTTYHLGNVTVAMPSQEAVQNYNTSATLAYLAAVGDQTTLGMVLAALSSVNQNADWLSLNSSAVANLTHEELMQKIAEIAGMNNDILNNTLQTLGFATLEQINVGSSILQSVLAGVYDNPLTLDMEGRNLAFQLTQKMADQITAINVSDPYELQPFLSNTMDSMCAVIEGLNKIILQEEENRVVPPSDTNIADTLDYNTDTPTDYDDEIPTDMNVMLENNVYDTTKYRAKAQVAQVFSIIDQISSHIQDKLVVGEFVKATAPHGASVLIAKLNEILLVNGMNISAGSSNEAALELPILFCPSKYNTPHTKCREEFGLLTTVWPTITYMYPDSCKVLSNDTEVIDLSVDIRKERVNVANETRPIIFHIPRKQSDLPSPLRVNVSEHNDNTIPLIYHYFNISNFDTAYTVEITPDGNLPQNMVLLIDRERMPTPSKYLKLTLIRTLPRDENGTYRLFVGSEENNNKTGRYFGGVGVLKSNVIVTSSTVLTKDSFESRIGVDYSFRVYLSGCYYYDNFDERWSGRRVVVTKATPTVVTCAAYHLTPFASGFLPTPNVIDFNYVFANYGFIDNLTIYVVLIILICLYIIMMIWGHYMDRKDIERRGVIPLPDNNLNDKYLYEVTFHTGPDKEATTDSNIKFIASGDYGETEVRSLPPANYYLYRRFAVNTFVMATSKPLGHVNYLRVFHDNSGEPPLDTWQLQMVVFRDLQTNEKSIFDVHTWLAFNRDEGTVDKTFMSQEGSDEKSFSQNMHIRGNKAANQDHMWMAMFTRPLGSRFGRKERVSVCAVFLYLSMLASALWYNSAPETKRGGYFNFGPLTLGSDQVITGACILFVAYPFVYILSIIFKRARPRNLKRCRALDSIETQKELQLIDVGIEKEEAETRSKVEVNETKKPRQKEKSPIRCIPWWTRIIAWIFVIAIIAGSSFLVWSYGILWGEIKTVQWFSSFILSFLISVVITQWLKVLIHTLVASSICKADLSIEDTDCDEELPALKYNEEWTHVKYTDPSTRKKVHSVEGVDIDDTEVAALRIRMMKEREMGFVIRGIIAYCLFLAVLYILVNGRTDYNAFLMKDHLVNSFIKMGDPKYDFTARVKTTSDWWYWAQNVILDETRAQRLYNDAPPYGLRGFMKDQTSRTMGYAILRQIRTKRFNCVAPAPMNQIISHCSGMPSLETEETVDFCAGWALNETFKGACRWDEFRYKTASELGTYPMTAKLATYGGGGYVFRLSGYQQDLTKKMTDLQKNNWIDQNTRAVILEFSIFNANVNLFATCVVMAEFNGGGGISPFWRFEPVRLINDGTFKGFMAKVCEIIFVIAVAFFTLRELWELKKLKCRYFDSYWNIAELSMIAVSYAAIGLNVYKAILTQEAVDIFNYTHGNGYVRMDSAVFIDQIYLYAVAIIVFFSTLKLIKLLQFNKRMNVLALTIRNCWEELKIFMLAFLLIFFAFSCIFYYMFMSILEDFMNITSALLTSFSMLMGKFDFDAMNRANALSPILFFVFSVMNTMVLINIIFTIIIVAFNEVKADLEKKENKLNIIDFVWLSFKQFIRVENLPRTSVVPKLTDKKYDFNTDEQRADESDQLPDKVGQLVKYINAVYFDGRLDMNDPQAKKSLMSGTVPANYLPFKDPEKIGKRTLLHSDEAT